MLLTGGWLRRNRAFLSWCAAGSAALGALGVLALLSPNPAAPPSRSPPTGVNRVLPAATRPGAAESPPEESPLPVAGPLMTDEPEPGDGGSTELVHRPAAVDPPSEPARTQTRTPYDASEAASPGGTSGLIRAKNFVRYDTRSGIVADKAAGKPIDRYGIYRHFDPIPLRKPQVGVKAPPVKIAAVPRAVEETGGLDLQSPVPKELTLSAPVQGGAPEPAPKTEAPLTRSGPGPRAAGGRSELLREVLDFVKKVRGGSLALRLEIGAALSLLVFATAVILSGMIAGLRKLYGAPPAD